MESILPRRLSYDWWGVLALVIAIYLSINLDVPVINKGFAGTYIIVPALWCLVAVLVLWLPKYRAAGKSNLLMPFVVVAATIAISQIAISIFGGLVSSFGNSPYDHSVRGIIQNLFYVGSALAGMEFSRAWLLNHNTRQYVFLKLTLISVVYALITIPLTQIKSVEADLGSVEFVSSTCLPALAESILASYLVLAAGPIPSLVYRGILLAFHWFCPILPDLEPMTQSLIGTAIPIMGLIAAQKIYLPRRKKITKRKSSANEKGIPFSWIAVSIIAVIIVWFSVGVFGYSPTAIISGSMQPELKVGDIVVVEDVSQSLVDNLQPGDIIEFTEGKGVPIVHRIIEIDEEGNFITKGDANSKPDTDPVTPQEVRGKVVYTIPKLGWVAIGIKEMFLW